MRFMDRYLSPLGELVLEADEWGLTGLWLPGQKAFEAAPEVETCIVLGQTKRWLDIYFSGREAARRPPLHLTGTPFQMEVWKILRTIPYGETMTYGQIGKMLGRPMSAQAVGGAVGRDPIPIIVPCHRVIGADSSLTGYAGGLEIKRALLDLEGIAYR